MESLLNKLKSILHSNHFIMISIKNALIELYGHVKGYLLSELPAELLRRKIELCKEVLAILDVFEGGMSRARGLMLYEMHAPMILIAKSQHRSGVLSAAEYLKELEKVKRLLVECLEIASWEDKTIYKQVKNVKVSMESLKNFINNLKKNSSSD